jgi:hypothetical protein
MNALPAWPPGTAAVLAVSGPHAIPVSTAVRLADRRIAFALGGRRDTLARLREDPAAALTVLAEGMAFTAYGPARVERAEMESAPKVAALILEVERIQDHLAGARTEILAGPGWRWTEPEAEQADEAVREELSRLA